MNGIGRGVILTACVLIIIIGSADTVRAGSSGNPVLNPMAREFTLSLELGYHTRDLDTRGRWEELSSWGMAVKGTYGITSRLAVFGRLGMADLRLDRSGFSGSLEPTYGAGLMLALYRSEKDPSVNLVLTGSFDRMESSDGGLAISANQYGSSLIVTKGVEDLLLYGGFRLSDLDLSGDDPIPDMDAADVFGFVAGVDYGVSERIYLSLETHLFDQYALVGGIGFNFGR